MGDKRIADLVEACKAALPYMVRLGDFIGNGEGDKPMGRCNAILAMKDAIEKVEACGYYCSEDVGHVDHVA